MVVEAQSGEDPAYSYYYTTNLYSQADEIQTVLLGFDMASTYRWGAAGPGVDEDVRFEVWRLGFRSHRCVHLEDRLWTEAGSYAQLSPCAFHLTD